ncbi:hypothetical protein AAFF_G00127060 [Aldrovandia affinis]|uniref:Uncharacterized protein n=1 Tax=Aldrovandia affinis TaxID=143900 RepID=A0AAD7T0W0_9TELE|nr:hypothetical protein AAFF_G00127060 [Aldrovandia affinis]
MQRAYQALPRPSATIRGGGPTHSPPKTQLAERKVAALSPQHHRQRRRRHSTPPVNPLGNGGYPATSEIASGTPQYDFTRVTRFED